MLASKPTGQGAASKKYDVITALGAYACAGDKHRQRRVLRFVTLLTARYNWQRDELSIGRAEIARLWDVDERTVKRDMGLLRDRGWLKVKRPAARGRVAVYSVDWSRILGETRGTWSSVGRDFDERMAILTGSASPERLETNVVAFPPVGEGATLWDRARTVLHRDDPAFHANWLAAVRMRGCHDGVLELEAPTPFHARYLATHAASKVLFAVRQVAPEVERLSFTAG